MITKEDLEEAMHPRSLVAKTYGDRYIWLIVILLSVFSLLAIYSSTGTLAYKHDKSNEFFVIKQVLFLIFGLGLMYAAHLVHYKFYSRISQVMLFVTGLLLLYTLFFGRHLNDASRWVTIPFIGISFQTSDLAKLILIMYIARMLSKKQEVIKDFKQAFLPILIPIIIFCGLIVPANLSTAAILFATCMLLLFIGRINLYHLAGMAATGLVALILFVLIAKAFGIEGRIATWENRIKSFSNSTESTEPFQVQQASIAISRGGIVGQGPGMSTQKNFLPHPYSDFIFSIIIEEYGLMGAIIMVALYLLFLFRCIRIFVRSKGAFGGFLAVGLGFALTTQALMHMAVNVHLTPVTGVTLPFVSMGGTSLIFTSLATGIILSVSKNVEEERVNQGSEVAISDNLETLTSLPS